jgi:hypothetical protein
MASVASAQNMSDSSTHGPQILHITREFLKPYRDGSAHEKTEGMFAQAMAAAKWPAHYFGVDSVSGKSRSLFFSLYPSFDAWEKDQLAQQKNATLSSALDRINLADGDLLESVEQGFYIERTDQSLNSITDLSHMRMIEIESFKIKPGHEKDWDEAVKLVKAAYEKVPGSHWAMYEEMYGSPGGRFLVIRGLKSASEIDKSFSDDMQWMAAMGMEGMKQLSDLVASGIESVEKNLFVINPRESYPPEEWVKSDPDFWMPKAAHKPMGEAKKAEKPSGAQ